MIKSLLKKGIKGADNVLETVFRNQNWKIFNSQNFGRS